MDQNMQKKIVLSAKGIKKSFRKESVLKGVDFEIQEGEIFALLGSNGAGKTTAVRILSGNLFMDSGSVKICGYDLQKQPREVRQNISVTGQFATLDEMLTGEENLFMVAKLFHIDNFKEKSDKLFELFGLDYARKKRVCEYSGGMKRRLDIALGLVGEPKLIFLDEPTTGLDPQSRNAVWQIIRELKQRGISIFLTTQYLEEAEQLADNISILHNGQIVAQGDSESLKKTLPEGVISLEFYDNDALEKANDLLMNFSPEIDEETIRVLFKVEDSIKFLQTALIILSENKVRIKSFSQQKPSLEDVFLTIIGEGRVKNV